MKIMMVGVDYELCPLAQREQLSFQKNAIPQALLQLQQEEDILGALLLSTCNRTELYLSYRHHPPSGKEIFSALCGIQDIPFTSRQGEDCLRHLFLLACGLKSQILGEEQILSQLKEAVSLAQEVHTMDRVLNSLFRCAITCGKERNSKIPLRPVSTSTAHHGIQRLETEMGDLTEKKVLVVGNGEMGRLSARLLLEKKAEVWVTLRSYRHGETLVPAGCHTVPYEDRYTYLPQMDYVLSATKSPHHTLTYDKVTQCQPLPQAMIDLAVPRDIDPACATLCPLWNVDDFGGQKGISADLQEKIELLLAKHQKKFRQWWDYAPKKPPRFPLFMDLQDKKVLVVGAGKIGQARGETLAEFGADITFLDPNPPTPPRPEAKYLQKHYETGDIQGYFLCLIATDQPDLNKAIALEGKKAGVLVNVADNPPLCDFYFPALCRDNTLVVGLVGDGSNPKHTANTAKKIRTLLEQEEMEWKSPSEAVTVP